MLTRLLIFFMVTVWGACAYSASAQTSAASHHSELRKKLLNLTKKYQELLHSTSAQKPNQAQQLDRFADGEFLYFAAYSKHYYLGELLTVKDNNKLYVNFNEFNQLVQFAIELGDSSNSASGWYLEEQNNFSIQYLKQEQQVLVNSTPYDNSAMDVAEFDQELYVSTNFLGQWFDITSQVKPSGMRLTLQAPYNFPVDNLLTRQGNHKRHGKSPKKASAPLLPSNNKLISAPLVDLDTRLSSQKDQDFSYSYNGLGTIDLAYMHSQFYFSGSKGNEVRNVKLKLQKESESSDLLGPLQASKIELGDITSQISTAKRAADNYGVGINISNTPLNNISINNSVDINGFIKEGWDIELYRNGLLINSQSNISGGEYRFENVELQLGDNNFDLIMYGPQGQINKEQKHFYLNKEQIKDFQYQLSLIKLADDLFDNDYKITSEYDWSLSAEASQKLSATSALSLSTSEFWSPDKSFNQSKINLNQNLFDGLFLQTSLNSNSDGFHSLNANAKTLFKDQHLSLNYRKAISDKLPEESEQLGFSVSGDLWRNQQMSLGHRTSYQEFSDSKQISSDLSFYTDSLSLSNRLNYVDTAETNTRGFLSINSPIFNVMTRFGVNYQLDNGDKIRGYSLKLYPKWWRHWRPNIGIDYTPETDYWHTDIGLSKHIKDILFHSSLRFDSEQDWQVSLFFNYSFGYEPEHNRLITSPYKIARKGNLAVRVFQDNNNDAIYNDGDELLPNVKIKAEQSNKFAKTDEKGIAELTLLRPHVRTDIAIDEASLPDPFLIMRNPKFSIQPQPGMLKAVDIPMVMSQEIEGTLFIKTGSGEATPLAYTNIDLLDENKKLVLSTKTEFDGFYLFSKLKTGKYYLDLSDNKHADNWLAEPTLVDLHSSKGDFGQVVNLTITPKKEYSGYIAWLKDFNSLTLLKVYANLLKLPAPMKKGLFHIFNQKTKVYSLILGFSLTEAGAEQICRKIKVSCTVKPFAAKL